MGSTTPECPRCDAEVATRGEEYWCPRHGRIEPLWKPEEVGYDAFAALLLSVGSTPTYLPWPMSPGWSVSEFGHVAGSGDAHATVTTSIGTSDLDGPVEVTVVSEDPGVGLGARCAGLAFVDPGGQVGQGPQAIHVRTDGHNVPMWLIDSEDDEPLERSVFAGEADGRWLWLVVRPGPAALMLKDQWRLADATGFGPQALQMPFGGPRPAW